MMRRNWIAAVAGLALALSSSAALAQSGCTGQGAAGTICGNAAATPGLGKYSTLTELLDRAAGSTQGRILNRGASVWSATATPSLGLNGATGGALSLQGATSGASTIRVPAAAGTGTVFQLPPDNGSAGFVLRTDGSGNTSWVTNAAGGTVTSVGLALPGIFSVSGSPVTASGTLTATLANQSANTVWAGPTSGGAAAPTFRALVNADLPAPTLSALGGVQAVNPVASQWVRAINTSGVPQLSQPAFTDISGTLAASQCPTPSASTIGCVQSFAAVTSQWIRQISTGGVISASQPAFTDLSGNASLAQLPSIGNNSILGNNSGGTAVPSALSASQVLDMIGTTRGQVLYRGASGWAALGVGTGGQVLTTGGAGADPSWTTVTGTGTVTNIATGAGLTGGPITTTGTIQFDTIANQRILANTSGGVAIPVATTMTSLLDIIGSTQGQILYRGASNWTALAPGTNGQVLTMGASTPAWGSAGSVTNVTISTGAGLTSSGSCNISTTGTCTLAANNSMGANKLQVFTSGSGTITTPSGAAWVKFTLIGGGGSGSGGGSTGVADGNTGGNTCINTSGSACTLPVYQAGGGTGGVWSVSNGGVGGTCSGSGSFLLAVTGGRGTTLTQNFGTANPLPGSRGADSPFGFGIGGGGASNNAAGSAGTGYGAGGQGGGAAAVVPNFSGSGGASGAGCIAFIQSPAASYTYAVGSNAAGGAAGTNGQAGGASSGGLIIAEYGFN